jgi:hypothetical protein
MNSKLHTENVMLYITVMSSPSAIQAATNDIEMTLLKVIGKPGESPSAWLVLSLGTVLFV